MSFIVNISTTGDCMNMNAGAAILEAISDPFVTTPPFSYDWVVPSLGGGASKDNLSAGTYVVRVNDSTTPNNLEVFVNVNISSGICTNIISTVNSTCGLANGVLNVSGGTLGQEIQYLLYSGNTLLSTQNGFGSTSFINLDSGIYSIVSIDSGGCTAQTQSCVISDSSIFDFGFFVVPESPCQTGSGRVQITDITPSGTYQYVWRDQDNNVLLQTGSTITGLTSGMYSVTVISEESCVLVRNVLVPTSEPLGGLVTNVISPSCFSSDGEITLQVTGGTGPYLYSGSNGSVEVSYTNLYTFTGLSAGNFNMSVTDISLCNFQTSTFITTPNTFIVSSVNIRGSNCSSSDGSVMVIVNSGTPPYTYSLSGNTGIQSINSNSTTQLFDNLGSGTYLLTISASSSSCLYEEILTINSTPEFAISSFVTGTTCSQNNGILQIIKTLGGTSPYLYQITGPQNLSLISSDDTIIFNNLPSGFYNISVTTNNGCMVSSQNFIPNQPPLNFTLFRNNCVLGEDGEITAIITSGVPPFTMNWFPNVSNGIYATGLTAGNYSLEITDSNGCSDIKEIEISCSSQYNTYQTFNVCKNYMNFRSGSKFGVLEMLNTGFQNLNSGDTTCNLISADFIVIVTANTIISSTTIYSGISLIDVPSDQMVFNEVKNLLLAIVGIGGVEVLYENNLIRILSDCTLDNQIDDIEIKVELLIVYNMECNDD